MLVAIYLLNGGLPGPHRKKVTGPKRGCALRNAVLSPPLKAVTPFSSLHFLHSPSVSVFQRGGKAF